MRKEKILVSLIVITLIAIVYGSVSSLATTISPSNTNSGNSVGATISASKNNTANDTNTNANKANTNTNTNNANGTNVVGSSVNAVTDKNNAAKNTNTNTNTKSSKLPYAGTNTSIIFVVIALIASAIYAYKKVSDYNV